MNLVPTQEDVVKLLRATGALRDGHFRYPSGLHSSQYVQVPLAMRYYQWQSTLSVGLSRSIRANPEIHAIIGELSVVAPGTGGLPVAFGVCEALRAHQVYWAERECENAPLTYRQFLEQSRGEQVLLVDDILRSGQHLTELRSLVESNGAKVVGVAVVVYQPLPKEPDFGEVPVYYLARIEGTVYGDDQSCELCEKGIPLEKVWR